MLDISHHHGVAVLTLNRPRQRNAMSPELVAALIAACQHAAADPQTGAILLTGADSGFCAGSDLAALAALDAAGRGQFEAESGRLARLFGALPLPVLAAVHGFAIGGGLTLAAACDSVVTHPDARWSLPEVPIGLFPAWGLHAVTARIGSPAARRLAWGIQTLTGAQAVALGLADQLAADPHAEALAQARALAALPRPQAAAVKAYFAETQPPEAADRRANQRFLQMCETPHAVETLARFSRRPPGTPND